MKAFIKDKVPAPKPPVDLRPVRHYNFRSATGLTVTISSRLGEDSARAAAMQHFWGPPCKITGGIYNGLGLSLIVQSGQPIPAMVEDAT